MQAIRSGQSAQTSWKAQGSSPGNVYRSLPQLHSRLKVSAMSTKASATTTVDMQERMEFLKEDLMHLFDDQGVDETQYDKVVTFLDPITRYSNVQGYMFNIRMLKTVFAPNFELHDIKQTGPYEATTRWTMTMKFTPAQALQLSKWWEPVITFTGTSTYGFNPANGKINRHIDTWDSISNQQFFSFEAFGDFWQQLLQTYTTPALESPRYTLLRRTAKFQVRQYEPFTVAATLLDNVLAPPTAASSGNGSPTQTASAGAPAGTTADGPGGVAYTINPASAGMKAFNALAGYIFGGNVSSTKMKMTTPVLSDSDGQMQFVVTADVQKVAKGAGFITGLLICVPCISLFLNMLSAMTGFVLYQYDKRVVRRLMAAPGV